MVDYKIVLLVLSMCFLLVFVFVQNNQLNKSEGILVENTGIYQGPVPEGYDEEHFRNTGITKPIE